MTLSIIFNMTLTAILSVWAPGPNNVMMFALASKYGVKKNLRYLCGIWTGCFMIIFFTGILCNFLVSFVPRIAGVMKYVGAAYLAYLAYKTLLRKPPKEGEVANIPGFVDGMMLQLVNVHLILYAITMFSSFILAYTQSAFFVFLSSIYLVFFTATGNLIWAFAGNVLKPFYSKYYKIANVVMAVLILWCILRMLK